MNYKMGPETSHVDFGNLVSGETFLPAPDARVWMKITITAMNGNNAVCLDSGATTRFEPDHVAIPVRPAQEIVFEKVLYKKT
jgi:hypothetical protein